MTISLTNCYIPSLPPEFQSIILNFTGTSVSSLSKTYLDHLKTSHLPHLFLSERIQLLTSLDKHLIDRFDLQTYPQFETIIKIEQFYRKTIDNLNKLLKNLGREKLSLDLDENLVDIVEYRKAYNKIQLWLKLPGGIDYLRSSEMKALSIIDIAKGLRNWISENINVYNIIKLNLSKLNLTQLPEEIRLFSNLKSLSLSYNNISKIENLPSSIEQLNLSNNKISKIEILHTLTKLKFLDLSCNNILKIENLDDLKKGCWYRVFSIWEIKE